MKEFDAILKDAKHICSASDVNAALDQLASDMTSALQDKNPIFLCVLTGAIIPIGRLLSRLDFPLQLDYIHATRYGDETIGQTLKWIAKPHLSLVDRHVVIFDDVLDGGITLAEIVKFCEAQGPQSVKTAVLADKIDARATGGLKSADFTGLHVENAFLFGCGMDYKGYFRNLPAIYALKDH